MLNFEDSKTSGVDRILAVDCATKSGWALIENGQVKECGVQNFGLKRGESRGMMFLRFRKWLYDIVKSFQVQVLYYEAAHYRGGNATEICLGLTTRVQEVAAEFGIEYGSVPTSTLKLWAANHGKASKEAMIKAANQKTKGKFNITNDDIADAVCIGLFAAEQIMETGGSQI